MCSPPIHYNRGGCHVWSGDISTKKNDPLNLLLQQEVHLQKSTETSGWWPAGPLRDSERHYLRHPIGCCRWLKVTHTPNDLQGLNLEACRPLSGFHMSNVVTDSWWMSDHPKNNLFWTVAAASSSRLYRNKTFGSGDPKHKVTMHIKAVKLYPCKEIISTVIVELFFLRPASHVLILKDTEYCAWCPDWR